MASLLRDHLTRLADFSGRENRQPFWLWILAVYLAQMVVGVVLASVLMSRMMTAMQPLMGQDQVYIDQHPELAAQVMMGVMVPLMRGMLIFSIAIVVVNLMLVGAAVVRRLHDGDRSGWWASPVLVLQVAMPIAYLVIMPRFLGMMGSFGQETSPDQVNAAMASIMQAFMLVWLLGMIGAVLTLGLIVLLVLRGTVGPNRYGDDLSPPPALVPVPEYRPAPPVGQPQPAARIVRASDTPPTAP
ncbi:DUF805 domain-containing protein [Sphingomonas sp.]|uniref:DUF805 domain-containing protein n=1 Tax=Sphingomonas sp. TaxID=28214 RepID=UPI003B001297